MKHASLISPVVLAGWWVVWASVGLAAPVTWVVDTDGDWETPAHWSSDPDLPTTGDDVVIDRPGFDLLITLTANQSVRSLTSQESLHLAGGSLTLAEGGDLHGDLAIDSGRTLTINGGAFTAHGSADVNGANLRANSGGDLTLTNLAAYAGHTGFAHTDIRADGAGSTIDLSGVETMVGNTAASALLRIDAVNGGAIDLSALAGVTGGKLRFLATGADSVIDLSELASIDQTGNINSVIEVANGGAILAPNLTELYRVNLVLNGTGAFGTGQIVNYNEGVATITGFTPDFTGVTNADGSSFIAQGGAVIALDVTSYAASTGVLPTHLRADGAGSRLEMVDVTTMSGNTFPSAVTNVRALDGGVVDLSGVSTFTHGRAHFEAIGADSFIDLTNLAAFTSTGNVASHITAADGGTISLHPDDTATLTDVHLILTASGSIRGDVVELVSTGSTNLRTARLLGEGQLDASLLNSSGQVRPGDANAAHVTIAGDFAQGAAGSLYIDLLGTDAGEHDRLVIRGNATLGGTLVVNLDPGVALGPDMIFTILDIAGTRSGFFDGLEEGDIVASQAGHDLHISYAAGDGRSVALYTTVIPEPATAALLALLTPLLGRRRGRV